MISEED
jgi:hypothetical protein